MPVVMSTHVRCFPLVKVERHSVNVAIDFEQVFNDQTKQCTDPGSTWGRYVNLNSMQDRLENFKLWYDEYLEKQGICIDEYDFGLEDEELEETIESFASAYEIYLHTKDVTWVDRVLGNRVIGSPRPTPEYLKPKQEQPVFHEISW